MYPAHRFFLSLMESQETDHLSGSNGLTPMTHTVNQVFSDISQNNTENNTVMTESVVDANKEASSQITQSTPSPSSKKNTITCFYPPSPAKPMVKTRYSRSLSPSTRTLPDIDFTPRTVFSIASNSKEDAKDSPAIVTPAKRFKRKYPSPPEVKELSQKAASQNPKSSQTKMSLSDNRFYMDEKEDSESESEFVIQPDIPIGNSHRNLQIHQNENTQVFILSGLPPRLKAQTLKEMLQKPELNGTIFSKSRTSQGTVISQPSSTGKAKGFNIGSNHYIHTIKKSKAYKLFEQVCNGEKPISMIAQTMGLRSFARLSISKMAGSAFGGKPIVFVTSTDVPIEVIKKAVFDVLQATFNQPVSEKNLSFGTDPSLGFPTLCCRAACDTSTILSAFNVGASLIPGVDQVCLLNEFKAKAKRQKPKLLEASIATVVPLTPSILKEFEQKLNCEIGCSIYPDSLVPRTSIPGSALLLSTCLMQVDLESKYLDQLSKGVRLKVQVNPPGLKPLLISISTIAKECKSARFRGKSSKSKVKTLDANQNVQFMPSFSNSTHNPPFVPGPSVSTKAKRNPSQKAKAPARQTQTRSEGQPQVVSNPRHYSFKDALINANPNVIPNLSNKAPSFLATRGPQPIPQEENSLSSLLKLIEELTNSNKAKDQLIRDLQKDISNLSNQVQILLQRTDSQRSTQHEFHHRGRNSRGRGGVHSSL